MLKLIRGRFKCGSIPYYWIGRMNLLNILTPDEVCEYQDILNSVYLAFSELKRKGKLTYEEVAQHFDVPADTF